MTTYYVDRTRTGGANNGTSWANAWLTLFQAIGVAAGSEVWVDVAHYEDPGATNIAYNFSNGTKASPIRVLCVNSTGDTLATASAETIHQVTTGRQIKLQGNIYVDGLAFTATDDMELGVDESIQIFRNCVFDNNEQTTSNNLVVVASGYVLFDSCTIDMSDNASRLFSTQGTYSEVVFRNCTFVGHSAQTTILNRGERNTMRLYGCSFSGTCTSICAAMNGYHGGYYLRGCTLPAHTNRISATPGLLEFAHFEQCETGTHTVTPDTLTAIHTHYGTLTAYGAEAVADYRAGGAADGQQANAYSWKIVTTANTATGANPFRSPPLSAWVAGGAEKTFSIYFAGAADLYDDEIWVELEGPSNAASATSQYYCASSKCGARTTHVTNGTYIKTTADSEWTGSNTAAEQIIQFTYTPTLAGPVKCRVCVAKPNTTVYIDPQIVIT